MYFADGLPESVCSVNERAKTTRKVKQEGKRILYSLLTNRSHRLLNFVIFGVSKR